MIVSPPQIIVQPASQNLLVAGTAVFSVMAIGDLPLSYQWQENGTNLTDGGQFSGSATSTLTISNVLETNDGSYSVIVSNVIAPTNSDDAVLTVFAVSTNGTQSPPCMRSRAATTAASPTAWPWAPTAFCTGTTQNGGLYGDGTIFSLSTNGTLTTLVSFDGTSGAMPVASLIQGANGLLYGTTELGGSNSAGTVFSMTPDGTLNSIYSFASTNDSLEPFTALAQDAEGNLYGASSNNTAPTDGNIFKMTPDGLLTNLYSFPSSGGLRGAGRRAH